MIATELRVGNLLNYCGNTVTVMEILRNNRVELGYFTDSIGFVRSLDDENIKPIPLTEEWVTKCDKIYWLSKDIGGYFLWFNGDKIYIKYVHSLQTLYFALTNEELKIEL